MHAESLLLMAQILDKHKPDTGGTMLLDVGSYDVNGTYRAICEAHGYQYTGLDTHAGPNVDTVADNPYSFPVDGDSYDVVISGQTAEHVERPWLWVPELARVLKPGGMLVVITHHTYPEHKHPVDCWRFWPDGMRVLFDEAGYLERYAIGVGSQYDTVGIAWKKQP